MDTPNPGKTAFYLSVVLTALSLLILPVPAAIAGKGAPWWLTAISALALFAFQYLVIRYFLTKFIFEKIKLIYKTIHSLKLSREEKRESFSARKGQLIDRVSDEVTTWAAAHKQEVEELRKLEVYRREFLANVSHELRTPLSNIQGFTLTLLDGGLEDPSVNRNYLLKVQNNAERMITIVNHLEVISRLESGEAKPEMVRFDMLSLIREVYEFLEPRAVAAGISLQLANDHYQPHYVLADKEQIRQVLVNLVENSVKYGREKGRTKISLYDMDENLLIEVSDNGMGIGDEHIPHLFERFYRVDRHRARSGGGSGLGLAIVKHIIEAHAQTVNVRSAPGVGSTFSFTLQVAR
jgi:two-component system phosphate regulon sensor histidine kinase PhoR